MGRLGFICAALISAVLCAAAVSGQSRRVAPTPTPTPPDEIQRIQTEEVKLNMQAFDTNGKFVSDVTDRDIVINEDNILHPPSSVRRLPANVLIVMDTGGELREVKSLDRTRRVARAVISALRPGDSIALMDYSDKAEVVMEWTTDKEQALKAIDRTNFGRRSDFVGALSLARDLLLKNPADNRHLVLITDGTDNVHSSSAKFDMLQAMRTTDISVHVISYTSMEVTDLDPRAKTLSKSPPPNALPDEVVTTLPNGVNTPKSQTRVGPTINMDRSMIRTLKARKADLQKSQEQLEKVAEATNGEFILPDSVDDMIDKAPLVAKMIDASYVVTYLPKIPINDRKGIIERNIEVTSKRAGLVVQAKRKLVIDNGQ
jgi:Mg-chelatase subunit ChlD